MLTESQIKEKLPERFQGGYYMPVLSDNVEDMQVMAAYYFCCFQEMQGALIQEMRKSAGMEPQFRIVGNEVA